MQMIVGPKQRRTVEQVREPFRHGRRRWIIGQNSEQTSPTLGERPERHLDAPRQHELQRVHQVMLEVLRERAGPVLQRVDLCVT
jgi:hypothetical protein